MNQSCPRIVVAGTHSGTGKTSVSLALAGALRRRGLRVQTFKVGPDFLDPTYLAVISDRPCYNLDGWMAGREYVRRLFRRVSSDADISVIEGVMGLFDGADAATSEGSTAEIARWLDAPVLLVVNAQGVSRSLAATVKGFATLEPDLAISGVVANKCGSERHAAWLADSLRSAELPSLVGAVPRGAFPELRSRHLGLVTADSRVLCESMTDALAEAAKQYVSVDDVLRIARDAGSLEPATLEPAARRQPVVETRVRIGVARDEAFHFYYQDMFDEMEIRGCEPVFFSPVSDARLPEGLDGLYFGGGYPEERAGALSANETMLDSVRLFAQTDRPIYAECGGLMYLSKGLVTLDGRRHALAGVLPAWTRMGEKKKSLGYVEATLTEDSLWGARGDVLRGHEFHYSEPIENPADSLGWKHVYTLKRRRQEEVGREGFQCGNILASYAHMHYASRPGAIDRFISNCEAVSSDVRVNLGHTR